MANYAQTDEAMKAVNTINGIVNRVTSALSDIGANNNSLQSNIAKIQLELDDPQGVQFTELSDAITSANDCISLLATISGALE